MDDKLLKEYQQEAAALHKRCAELLEERKTARGQKSVELEKRLRILEGMYQDVCYAIKQMSKKNLG